MAQEKKKLTSTVKKSGFEKKKKTDSKLLPKPGKISKLKSANAPRKKSLKKAGSTKTARKNSSEAPPFLSNEIKKIAAGLIILVFLAATGAMFADFYLGRPAEIMREKAAVNDQKKSLLVKKTPQEQQLKDHDGILDLKSKIPLESIKPKPVNKALPIAGNDSKGIHENQTCRQTTENSQPEKRNMDIPLYELFNDGHGLEKHPREPVNLIHEGYPRVAIIIDDIGFDKKLAYDLLAIEGNFTFSILPCSPFGRTIAENLHTMGAEIMLHLPMEPVQYPEINPGPGAILASMSPDVLIESLRKDIDAIPHARGVNNHMGSRITTLSPQMRQIFTILKQRDMFFIDSLTSRDSLCRQSARLFHLPFAQRDVFLDNIQDVSYIKKQLRQLVSVAKKHGSAVGIGHPYKATFDTLKQEVPRIRKQVRIVPASALVSVP